MVANEKWRETNLRKKTEQNASAGIGNASGENTDKGGVDIDGESEEDSDSDDDSGEEEGDFEEEEEDENERDGTTYQQHPRVSIAST